MTHSEENVLSSRFPRLPIWTQLVKQEETQTMKDAELYAPAFQVGPYEGGYARKIV